MTWLANDHVPVNRKYKCTFCESDDHGYKECGVKEMCIKCGLDNHKSDKCFWANNSCSWCGTAEHASKIHHTKDQTFRLRIMNMHGHELFTHFWADQKQEVQVQVQASPEVQAQGKAPDNGRNNPGKRQGLSHSRSNSHEQRIQRQQDAKPYSRQPVDSWTGSSRSKGARRYRR